MKTREPSKVRIPSLIIGPEYPFSTQSETFLIASLAERSMGDFGHLKRDIVAMADDVDGLSSTAS